MDPRNTGSSHGSEAAGQNRRGAGSSEWRKAQNRASQKTYREKKRKLLREKELRAAEPQALASKTAPERARLGMNDAAMPDTSSQPKRSSKTGHLRVRARSEESSRSAMPDLCPSVTTQPHYQPDYPPPEPPQAPATRKVRTIFPFDLSDPFKFQGMQPDFQAIDEIGKPVQVYSRIMAARNKGDNEEQADQGWNGL